MVVMDRVDGKSLWQIQTDKTPIPTIVLEHVRQAVHLLHQQNIVFGDLRDPNILYDASKNCTVIVDFDWSGGWSEQIPGHAQSYQSMPRGDATALYYAQSP